jgi:hypothetical protein
MGQGQLSGLREAHELKRPLVLSELRPLALLVLPSELPIGKVALAQPLPCALLLTVPQSGEDPSIERKDWDEGCGG